MSDHTVTGSMTGSRACAALGCRWAPYQLGSIFNRVVAYAYG